MCTISLKVSSLLVKLSGFCNKVSVCICYVVVN